MCQGKNKNKTPFQDGRRAVQTCLLSFQQLAYRFETLRCVFFSKSAVGKGNDLQVAVDVVFLGADFQPHFFAYPINIRLLPAELPREGS